MSARDKFDVLKMKDEIQRKVQGELAGSSPAERIARIRRMAEQGELRDWWAKAKRARRPRRCA